MNNLVTLQEYKSYKGLGNPEKDEIINILITSVSNLIKSYCGRSFIDYYDTPKTEAFTVTEGMTAVILEEIPIREVSSFIVDSVEVLSDAEIDKDMGIIYYRASFPTKADVVGVMYTGGYSETPADVKLAAFELIDYYLNSEHKARQSFGGSTVEYHTSKDSWPFHIRSILDNYKDV